MSRLTAFIGINNLQYKNELCCPKLRTATVQSSSASPGMLKKNRGRKLVYNNNRLLLKNYCRELLSSTCVALLLRVGPGDVGDAAKHRLAA